MMRTLFINHSEKSPVPKRSQESYRKVRGTVNGRESAMTLTCHNCKKPGHKKKDCKELMGKSDEPSNVDNGTTITCPAPNSTDLILTDPRDGVNMSLALIIMLSSSPWKDMRIC